MRQHKLSDPCLCTPKMIRDGIACYVCKQSRAKDEYKCPACDALNGLCGYHARQQLRTDI